MAIDPEPCTWTQYDEDGDTWESSCPGRGFWLEEGSPTANGMKFCCYCGRPLVEEPWRADLDDASEPFDNLTDVEADCQALGGEEW